MEVILINYNLLYDGDLSFIDFKKLIASNRNLPDDWCTRKFTEHPKCDFAAQQRACNVFASHILKHTDEKFQIVVDCDFDGVCSAAILYKFLHKFHPNIETVFSIHSGKQHGLSDDIVIDDNTTLVFCPDSASNDVEQCKVLYEKGIDVICLDHHIIERENPYAVVVNCMDGHCSNPHLCGATVTWLFLWDLSVYYIKQRDECRAYLTDMLDLAATATIADVMDVTDDGNMFFIQNGLREIKSKAIQAFLHTNELSFMDVTIESIKFKVAPLVSAMIRMGSMDEKILLFRAFIDDYEEFIYEKRGSFEIGNENIYDRVVRLCKNAKSRQDRAKQKLLDDCKIHEYPHILLVTHNLEKQSALIGLVANELAQKYCKPCIVYRENTLDNGETTEVFNTGSIRNYDNSPVASFKELLENALNKDVEVAGHNNSAGIKMSLLDPDIIAECVREKLDPDVLAKIGSKEFNVDFVIDADDVDTGFVQKMYFFEHYSGHGFMPVTALVTGIKVTQNNFKTMGKNTFNWKISTEYDDTGVSYIKFKVDRNTDELVQRFDDLDWDSENDYGKLYDTVGKTYYINAICTFGLNVYKGVIYPQCIVKDFEIREVKEVESDDDDDWDLDLEI